MSETKTIDVSHIKFSSTVFPTDEDMALWNGLSSEQQRAIIMRDIDEGLSGPPASNATKDEIMAEVLTEATHAL